MDEVKQQDIQPFILQELTTDEPAPAEPTEPAPVEPVKPEPLPNHEVTRQTAALWKYCPVPDTEPEPSPEYLSGETVYPGSKIIAARVRGKKHKHEGTNCDDWYETAHFEDMTFIAVSDGAGSKHFSRIGAQVSCKTAAGYLSHAFADAFGSGPDLREMLRLPLSDPKCMEACSLLAGLVQQSAVKAYEAVQSAYYCRAADPAFQAVLKREPVLADFSGTLLIAVLIPLDTESREQLIMTCQVGDGMIAILNTKGPFSSSLKLMGVPDSGEFSGETEFLTSPRMHQIETLQSKTRISRGVFDLVMVMSDGVADDYYPNETEMRRLYYDLTANGILDSRGPDPVLQEHLLPLCRRIPAPLAYPWVNDQTVEISLHYTDRICEAMGLSLEDLWTDPTVLSLCRTELDRRIQDAPPSERLRIWLDNYVQRGSFDDRTLVIAAL